MLSTLTTGPPPKRDFRTNGWTFLAASSRQTLSDRTASWPTREDSVLQRPEAIVAGRIGAANDDDSWAEVVAEGTRRVLEQLPPGYMDEAPQPDL